jgi:hypothetical protein
MHHGYEIWNILIRIYNCICIYTVSILVYYSSFFVLVGARSSSADSLQHVVASESQTLPRTTSRISAIHIEKRSFPAGGV